MVSQRGDIHSPSPDRPPLDADEEAPTLANIMGWWAIVRRRPLVPIIMAVLAATAMWIHQSRLPSTYMAQGVIHMGMTAGMPMEPGEYMMWLSGRERMSRTQVRLLTSDAVVERALHALGREVPEATARRATLRAFVAGVEVRPVEKTYLIEVMAQDPDPEEAALRVNALMESFVPFTNNLLASRFEVIERQLDGKRQRLAKKLVEAEAKLGSFYAESGNIQFEQRKLSLHKRRNELDARLNTLRMKRVSIEVEREIFATGLTEPLSTEGLEMLMAGLSTTSLQARIEPMTRLKAELIRLEAELLPDHPKVLLARKELQAHEAALRRVAGAVLSNLELNEQGALREEEKLKALLAELEGEIVKLEHKDGLYRTRKRGVERLERELEITRQRHLQAESRSHMDAGTTAVLSRAEAPEHPLPKKVGTRVTVAFLLALCLGSALTIGFDRVEGTVSNAEQARQLGLPILGCLPQLSKQESESVVLQEAHGRAAEAFREIRTYMAATAGEGGAVLVTSGAPGMGKTFVSLNLAAALARAGVRTLLVEGDMRKPRLQKAMGTSHELGLSDFLAGRAPLEGIVHDTELEALSFVASGPIPRSSSDLLATDRFSAFVKEALESFDQLIVDSPPVDVVSDASLMASHLQGAIFVVRLHRSRQRVAARAIELVTAVGGRPLGVVLNGFTRLDAGYGRRYGYGRYAYNYVYGPGEAETTLPTSSEVL